MKFDALNIMQLLNTSEFPALKVLHYTTLHPTIILKNGSKLREPKRQGLPQAVGWPIVPPWSPLEIHDLLGKLSQHESNNRNTCCTARDQGAKKPD